jgi:AraC family transcriptional regulator
MSEYHFFRIFKKAFGISPYQYLIDVRLNWAFQQIKQQQQSISSIAHETGFADLSSFSKAFSKKFGFPPSKWSESN